MKKKKIAAVILAVMIGITAFSGCGTKENKSPADTSGTGSSVEAQEDTGKEAGADTTMLEDGMYSVNVELQGGSGRATVDSVATVTVTDGQAMATIVWSSTYYDYMIVDDEKYLNENEGGNSTFTFPITGVPCEMEVIGDTTAMSTPHEIEYTLVFSFPETTSFNELNCEGHMNLAYADQFSIEQYGAYKLITIVDGGRYLLVPKGVSVPADVPSDIVVLQQPLTDGYLVSSAVMDLVCKTGALSCIKFTGLKEKDWYVQEAADAMKAGELVYAGKYNAPDYELLLGQGCKFAIENSMILHNPEVKEKLEELGIPVLIERSSYEKHPLGRLEWIRLFGVLFNQEQSGTAFFREQVERVQPILENAIYYGMEAMDDDGIISVRGYQKDGDVFLEISDNGLGMPEEAAAKLLTEGERVRSRGSGVGLLNVHNRIRLRFGEQYGLQIESFPDEGMTVRIHIPYIPYTEETCRQLEEGKLPDGKGGRSV